MGEEASRQQSENVLFLVTLIIIFDLYFLVFQETYNAAMVEKHGEDAFPYTPHDPQLWLEDGETNGSSIGIGFMGFVWHQPEK